MTQVINTKLLLEEGLLNEAQAAEIMRRSRETMLALVVNIVLCAGIIAASLGFVFWIADALGVALLGAAFLGLGIFVLTKADALYRLLGHASTLIGAGMLFAGGAIELIDKYERIADIALFGGGAAVTAAAAYAFLKAPAALRFTTGAVTLGGVALHLTGAGLLIDGLSGLPVAALYLYAAALIAAAGTFVNVRAVTALAIVPFAQVFDTGTAYFHAAYVFYSPEPTLTILQMGAAMGLLGWVMSRLPERIGRHAGILAIMAAAVGNLAFLVASLWGDEIGMSFFRDEAPRYSDFDNWQDHQAAYELWKEQFVQVSEHVYSAIWAVLLIAGAWIAAATHRRGLFNASVTFLGIHAYTQLFETFSDEPMVYALGGLAAIPAAWGLWRLNQKMFADPQPV